jgi:SNF2 family DNA or RNA helicase
MYAPTFVVVDEATSIKNPDANRTDNITHGLSMCHYIGKRLKDYEPYSIGRAILTGTPEAKGPYGLWSMLEFVRKDFWGMNYYAFKARYGIERQVYFPGMLRAVRKSLAPEDFKAIRKKATEEKMSASEIAIDLGMAEADVQYILDNPEINTPYKNLNELRQKLSTIAFTVKKADCLDLPEKVYEVVEVPMNDEQKRLYKEIKNEAYALYQNHLLDAANQVSIRLRLRQIAGGFFPAKYDLSEGYEQELEHTVGMPIGTPPKAITLVDRLENHSESIPAIVACAFTAEVYWVASYLKDKGYKVGVISGKVSKNERARIEDEFKAGELEVLVAQTSTIAKGYNFQISHTIYIYSNTYATEDRMQLEDRIHRYGQTQYCTYVDLIAQDAPIDRHVLDVIQGDTQFQEYMRSSNPSDFLQMIS